MPPHPRIESVASTDNVVVNYEKVVVAWFPGDIGRYVSVLSWVLYARERFGLDDLCQVLAESHMVEYKGVDKNPQEAAREDIYILLTKLGSLVALDDNGKYFADAPARAFLLNHRMAPYILRNVANRHSFMSARCIGLLAMSDRLREGNSALLQYARIHWSWHHKQSGAVGNWLDAAILNFLSSEEYTKQWLNAYCEEHFPSTPRALLPDPRASLEIAVFLRLPTIVQAFINSGDNVNGWSGNTMTPLRLAARGGFTEIIELLLKANVDLVADQQHGRSALHHAASCGHLLTVKLLLKLGKYDVNKASRVQNASTSTPLEAAIEGEHAAVVLELLNSGASVDFGKTNDTELNAAILRYRESKGSKIWKLVLAFLFHVVPKFNPDAVYHTQSAKARTPLLLALNFKDPWLVEELLRHGADVHQYNEHSLNPLRIAALGGDQACIEVLLRFNADIKQVYARGWSLLYHVIKEGVKPVQTVRLLLKHGADPDTPIFAGSSRTPLDHAIQLKNHKLVVELLSADPRIGSSLRKAMEARSSGLMELLVEHKIGLDNIGKQETTSLLLAALSDEREINRLLCDAGGSVIGNATRALLTELVASKRPLVVELYLRLKASLTVEDGNGRSALHLAVMQNTSECVSVIAKFSRNVNTPNSEGCTALHAAVANSFWSCANVLLQAGADPQVLDARYNSVLNLAVISKHVTLPDGQSLVRARADTASTNDNGVSGPGSLGEDGSPNIQTLVLKKKDKKIEGVPKKVRVSKGEKRPQSSLRQELQTSDIEEPLPKKQRID